ncbi:3-oxoacyl-[acyl-carrier protein] reductase [Alloactinosynnema sp. L-07]|uniref:SDR family NAD(P)-dependent oxidoreductase n=1 Tax=Alloactinosynnema sp. L-07 TaxID=1653480 RepID=UPI00065EF983|nr:3-oxoacyl-ACP reductase family protein [Alloactinosynnema sp. L-07]CRK55088.1 3-oxoacyl-[acyl-carrier protein] reductase [Alloactinosynnema sp. L-07]
MDHGLHGKHVLVTGGSRGIGRATVHAFAKAGAKVVAVYHQPSDASQQLACELKELGDGHLLVQADVTDAASTAQLAEAVNVHFGGKLDVLVNNVGVDGRSAFGELAEEEWHRVMDHNVTSAYLVTNKVLDQLVEGASIVNIGSSLALRGRAFGVHYTASKAALIGLTRALCKELGPKGIRVNLVSPGVTETEPGGGLPPHVQQMIVGMTALGRMCQPEDVAGAVLYLAGATSKYVTGSTINVDGGV